MSNDVTLMIFNDDVPGLFRLATVLCGKKWVVVYFNVINNNEQSPKILSSISFLSYRLQE